MLALTLFRLKPGRTVEEYREYTVSTIRPGMNAMPSVLGFRDLEITGVMAGSDGGWQLIELIEITSEAEFEQDNTQPPGKDVADDWATWVEEFSVLWCREL